MNSEELMGKLKELYEYEEKIIKEIEKLKIEYDQVQLDKEMLKTSIMYMTAKGK